MSYYGAVVNHMFGQNQITASELATIPVWNMTSQEVDKFEVQGMMSDSVDPPIDGAAPFLEETVRLNQISEEVVVHDTMLPNTMVWLSGCMPRREGVFHNVSQHQVRHGVIHKGCPVILAQF